MEYKACIIKGLENSYLIGEDGSVYGIHNKRLLKQYESSIDNPRYSYLYVTLRPCHNHHNRISVHRLVAIHFIGPIPGPEYEVDHIDGDKRNNHYTNLQYVTHQQNILKARQDHPWKPGRPAGFKLSQETKQKMAERKYRKVLLFNDNQDVICDSVEKACEYLGTYRRMFNRFANTNKTLNGFKIKVLKK